MRTRIALTCVAVVSMLSNVVHADEPNDVEGVVQFPVVAVANAEEAGAELARRILAQPSLRVVVAYLLPLMEDGDTSVGTAGVALWASRRLEWREVYVRRNETSHARALRRIDRARGKRLCVPGRIIEIERHGMTSEGLMADPQRRIYHFRAAGSSGDLIDYDLATFCGVVTQVYEYERVDGDINQALDLVGMFRLPENM